MFQRILNCLSVSIMAIAFCYFVEDLPLEIFIASLAVANLFYNIAFEPKGDQHGH